MILSLEKNSKKRPEAEMSLLKEVYYWLARRLYYQRGKE